MSDACAKGNAMHRASSLVLKLRQSAVELVVITYSTLVKGNCCEGHADRSLRVVVEMKSHESFASDEVIYRTETLWRSTLFTAVASSRDVEQCRM